MYSGTGPKARGPGKSPKGRGKPRGGYSREGKKGSKDEKGKMVKGKFGKEAKGKTKGKEGKGRDDKPNTCMNCGKQGHWNADCWKPGGGACWVGQPMNVSSVGKPEPELTKHFPDGGNMRGGGIGGRWVHSSGCPTSEEFR